MIALTSPDLIGRLLNARTTVDLDAIMAGLPIVDPDHYQWDYPLAAAGCSTDRRKSACK